MPVHFVGSTSGGGDSGLVGTPISARGEAGGSLTNVTVCEIALADGVSFRSLEWAVSSMRDALFQVVLIDDPSGAPVETILADIMVGPGEVFNSGRLGGMSFSSGNTDPVLRLRAKNFNGVSDFRGSITTRQN